MYCNGCGQALVAGQGFCPRWGYARGLGGVGFGHPYWDGSMMPFVFLRFARFILFVKVALALAAGFGLMQKASWGRWVAIVAGCLAIFHPLLGTALGIWTLAVLLNAPNAAGYEVMAR